MKLSLFALSAALLSQVSGAVIPSNDANELIISEDTSPNLPQPNVLEKRASWSCEPSSNRPATSAGLERIAVYFDQLGETRWGWNSGYMRMRTEENRDKPGAWSAIGAYRNAPGKGPNHRVASSGHNIAHGIREIIENCKNNNCPGKSYCGVGGSSVAYGNGEFVLKAEGYNNW